MKIDVAALEFTELLRLRTLVLTEIERRSATASRRARTVRVGQEVEIHSARTAHTTPLEQTEEPRRRSPLKVTKR